MINLHNLLKVFRELRNKYYEQKEDELKKSYNQENEKRIERKRRILELNPKAFSYTGTQCNCPCKNNKQ